MLFILEIINALSSLRSSQDIRTLRDVTEKLTDAASAILDSSWDQVEEQLAKLRGTRNALISMALDGSLMLCQMARNGRLSPLGPTCPRLWEAFQVVHSKLKTTDRAHRSWSRSGQNRMWGLVKNVVLKGFGNRSEPSGQHAPGRMRSTSLQVCGLYGNCDSYGHRLDRPPYYFRPYFPSSCKCEDDPLVQEIFSKVMNCQLCRFLLVDPTSLGCAHTFCETCIHCWIEHCLIRLNIAPMCPKCYEVIRGRNGLCRVRVFDELIANFLSTRCAEARLKHDHRCARQRAISARRRRSRSGAW
ncbi:hypothetical protein HDE_11003 [Halotydeus destructor]|nr:hypothetical protein HDE_11003 [Halotydeus destructor]